MEEQINNLLIELVASGELEPKDSGDMKIALLETIPAELVKQSKDFFKNLKARFETNSSQIFSETGIDLSIIKSITEEVVQTEIKSIDMKKEEEIKIAQNNARRFEESFAESFESEETKTQGGQEALEEQLGFPPFKITEAFLNEISNYIDNSGYNLKIDKKMFAQEVMFLAKSGLDKGKAMIMAMRFHVGESIKKSIESGKKIEESFAEIGIDPKDRDKVADAKGDIAGSLAFDMSAAFARKLLDKNPNAHKGILVDEIFKEEFIQEYLKSRGLADKYDQAIVDLVVQTFKENATEMVRKDTSIEEREETQKQSSTTTVENGEKQQYYDIRAVRELGKAGGPSKATELRFKKVFYNRFGYRFAFLFGGSDKRVVEDFRQEIDVQKTRKTSIEFEIQQAIIDKQTDFEFYYNHLQEISNIDKIILDDREHIDVAVNRNGGATLTQGEKNAKNNRKILIDDILKRYFTLGGSLYEYYSEVGGLVEDAALTFDELMDNALQHVKSGVTTLGDSNVTNIKSLEYEIQKKTLEYKAAGLSIEALTGKKVYEIDKMTPEELDDIRKSLSVDLIMLKEFDKSLKKRIDADNIITNNKALIRTLIDKTMTPEKIESFMHSKENTEKKDYLGQVDDVYNNMSLEERISFMNSIINDKNVIYSMHKKNGISMEDAAKMYFESNPGRIGRYSAEFEDILFGRNSDKKFDAKMIDEIILFQNSKLLNQIEAEQHEIDRKIEFDTDINMNPEKLSELLIKKNEYNNQQRVSNALVNLLLDKDGSEKTRRNDKMEELIDTYLFQGGSVHSMIKKYEYDSARWEYSKICDIDENELIMKIAKRFEAFKEGAGKEFINRERRITELEIKIEAYKMSEKKQQNPDLESNAKLIESYESERSRLIQDGYKIVSEYKDSPNKNGIQDKTSIDRESIPEDIGEEKRGISKLNIQGLIKAQGVSENAVVEQHAELKRLAEQNRTQDKESISQEETTEDRI